MAMVTVECLTVLISSRGDTNAVSLSPSSPPQHVLSGKHTGGGVYRTSESSSDSSSSSCQTFTFEFILKFFLLSIKSTSFHTFTNATYYGGDGGCGTQEMLHHLVSVVERFHQISFLLCTLRPHTNKTFLIGHYRHNPNLNSMNWNVPI